MTLKADIFSVLQEQTDYDSFYGSSTNKEIPYIRFVLGSHHSDRLSNKKALKNIWYQVDVFTYTPIDVESDTSVLHQIESALESRNLITTDWIEVISEGSSTQYTVYHYFIEARK